MVVWLFALALVSFALMGLFVVSLALYTTLARKHGLVRGSRDDLLARLRRRQDLLREADAAVRARWPDRRDLLDGLAAARATGGDGPLAPRLASDGRAADALGAVAALDAARRDETMAAFCRAVADADAEVARARRACDAAAADYDIAARLLPARLIARVTGLAPRAPSLAGDEAE